MNLNFQDLGKVKLTMLLVVVNSTVFGQLTGAKYIPGDYATITSAVTALNSSGVGTGGVTFNVAANYTETISSVISITATGTSGNPVVFQKDTATPGSNPLITAYTGGAGTPGSAIQDGIIRFVGSDYISIDGIDVRDNPSNTTNPSTMEYGYALYKASTSNGCQNITIKNCVITLNTINNATGTAPMVDGSTGIIVMNALASTATTVMTPVAGGTNSNNKFYANKIQSCNNGIALIGYAAASPFTLADAGNDIGGSSAGTGNTIINYGGAPGALNAAAGVRTLAQYGLNISYNTINNNNGSGTNHPNALRGIYINTATSASSTVTYNTITLKGAGTIQTVTGIENAAGSTPAGNTISISNNAITNGTYSTATTGGFIGILNSATPAILTISTDTISNNSSSATGTGFFYGINNTGAATTVTISSNIFSGNTTAALTTGLFVGIWNAAASSGVTINTNTLVGNSTTALSGVYYAIYNTGAVTTILNINSNNIGNGITGAFTFNAANSGTQVFINNTAGAATAALSISSNNFQGISYAVQGTGANTYISNTAATLSQAINSNTFTGLNINTTGSITFIANSVAVSSAGTQNVNSNSIVSSFNKATAGGTVTLFTSAATSVTGSIINNNSNNFSGITVTGATIIAGWVNTDAGGSTKTIQNNIFSNWTGGTSAITAMSISLTGTNNSTTGNAINNISGAGVITGIATAAGNDNIYSNNINTLVSSGTLLTTVNGISVTAGTTKNIYQNTIYNLQGNSITTGTVRGIVISGGATINVYQNNIYALQGNAVTTGSVNGISISGGTVINAYQNTIYTLQANSLTTGTLNGIWVSGGATVLAYSNKIYDLSSSSSVISGFVNGVQVSGATASTTTIRNNLIGDIRTPSASSADPVRGLDLISTGASSAINVYNNTVYLNAVSGGTNFGSTGIYHTTSATATTATLDLRNNIIINASVPAGTGLTVAYRRSSSTLTNYASVSNNNLFYAGLAAANRLLFYDGTNSDQFLSTYKARVSSRDAVSVTEDMITAVKFLNTSGSAASFLHIDPTKATQAESGGVAIVSVTTDFDGDTRQGSAGYAGTGTAPDIGADEMEGIRFSTLSGTYNVGAGQTFTSLTNADGLFANINSRGLSGNVIVNITADLIEDGTNALYQWAEQGTGNYTLTIQPDASTARIIAGNTVAGMIQFNGADRVIIDGRNNGSGSYLTFRNTNTAGATGTAFTFINGATSNTIRYVNIEAYANATNGVVLFSTSTVAGGNSSNSISFCNINATVNSNTANLCIYSAGTVGKENAANTISSNNIFNYRDRALDITATGSTGWTISGNSFYNGDAVASINYASASTLHGIRISGGAGYLITNNYFGGNAALAGGTSASYSSTLGNVSFQGIVLTTSGSSPASNIKGNTIANITLSSVPTVAGSIAFSGIETSGSGINIGGVLAGEGNMIGSNTVNSSINIITTTGTATFTTTIRGISCSSTGGSVIGNQAGGIDIKNIGTAPAPSTFTGINISNATAPAQVNNNIIGSTGTGSALNSIRVLAASTAVKTAITGIAIASTVTSAVQVDGNIIKNLSHLSTVTTLTAGGVIGISNASTGASAITITNNTISSLSFSTYTTGIFYGIYNSGTCSAISINTNTICGNTTSSATGVYYAIYNAGVVTTTININSNNIGNSTTGAFTFTAANAGAQVFINNTAGAAASALTISNNNFQGITYLVTGSGTNTYISNTAATLSQTINGNTFTSLSINTTNSITFISNSVIVPVTGTQNVNNNSIATAFSKTAVGGTVTLFTSVATSVAGSVINNNSNNFSNITVTGATVIAGWVNTDAGNFTKNIQNNIFSNWTGGTSAVTALSVNLTGTGNATTGNLINNISGAGSVTGITTGAGNDNIYLNTINTLSSTGAAAAVTGIAITAGTTKNIYKNKIYDLSSSNATGTVNGILVSGGTTVNVYNNLTGDLRTPAANSATDAIRGISIISATVSSTINVYYNTIYLNASSTGAAFSTSAVYHVTNATATTATLDLRNNSITNTSTPKGTGVTVAYHRSSATLTNYAATSNNNLLYAGTPGTTKLIFYDGTNADQTIAAFKTRVSSRESLSVTENLTAKFLSTTGSSSVFLHMDATIASLIESGAANITGFTDDIDGQIRAGNTGYTGSSSSPDIGADEIFGIETIPPAITYTLLTNTTSVTNRNVTGVVITDASGVNVASGTKPRIYYKRFSDANVWLDNTSGTNGWKYKEATNLSSPFTFTIDYSLLYGGASVTAGVIQYFIVAQDIATIANIGINSGTFNTAPSSVALFSSAFPVTGTINSYNIPFSGAYNVGNSEVFTSFTKADGLFASINTAGLMGNVTVSVTSNLTEDGTSPLDQWTESGAGNYTVGIQPDGAATRNVTGNTVSGLIRLDGADRVTLNGNYGGGGSYLSFKNTNTSGTGTVFSFLNGASNNTIEYCDVEAYANATNGVILFSTSAASSGNNNNLIDNCTINATVNSNTGSVAIYSSGTPGKENSANTISNNAMYNYRDRAIDITATGSTGWTITGNSLYNGDVTGSVNYAAASALQGIRISGGSGYAILNNFIGGNANQASGVNAVYSSNSGNISYQGILLSTTSATPVSDIKGNTIAAITISSVPTSAGSYVFEGIETNGSGINIGGSAASDGNTIGSSTNTGSLVISTSTTSTANTSTIIGINCTSSGGVINNNKIGGFDISNIGTVAASSVIQGIYVKNASAPAQVNNNLIGSTSLLNCIRILPASASATASLTGIEIGTAVNAVVQVNGNSIENISNLSTVSSGSFTGINNTSSLAGAVITISSDTIQNISTAANSNSGSTVYSGIFSSSAAVISNNIISNITLASTGANAQIAGINVSGAYANTVSGNIISGLSTTSGKEMTNVETGTPASAAIIGILNSATAAGQVISNNILLTFSFSSAIAVNSVVTGIGITAIVSGSIFNNRIASFTNNATGTAPAICGIMAASGSFNAYNNSIWISNSSNTNGIKMYGIDHAAASNWNYYYNTIEISGNSGGTALRSAPFILSVNASLILRNNIFINIRTGTGFNYAVSNLSSPAAAWSAATSDYNDLYSSNSNTVGEWGNAASKTFAQWQSSSGGDVHSISNSVSFISSTYDLEPYNATNCAISNTGTPIASPIVINTDINNVSRSATMPDMGAYEFNYTGFIVSANNNSPVCAGSTVDLTADAGNAVSPAFSWKSPSNTIVSILQNPTVAATAGTFTVTVTDINGCYVSAGTLVSLNQRPVAAISGATAICEGSSANIVLTVTGTGTMSGTLNDGTYFSGTAPSITVPVSPAITTRYYINDLSDASCSSIRTDIPDTVTIAVTHTGDWLGATSTNWNDATNWCGGIPVATTNVNIQGGLSNYPVISTGTNALNNLTIGSGASLTINGAVLQIGATITNSGTFYTSNGSIEMNGLSAQTIPAAVFAGNTISQLTINNNAGVTLDGTLNLTGILAVPNGQLDAAGYLTLVSTATQTALIDGSGAGNVVGNVTMQRYLASGYGYKYFSSPFQAATVNEFSNDLNLAAPFTSFYRFDENLLSDGWVNYTNSSGLLNPGEGYAGNFGSSSSAKTVDITGVVNNGNISYATLYNHNRPYTQGFNLVGNPYPSPVNWDAAGGWTKTNIDNAVYYFNAGTTDQYTGVYSSYINGVSSDGIAGSTIAAMQGFFVHVSNGTFPVSGLLSVNNSARTLSPAATFFRVYGQGNQPLLRLSAGFADETTIADPVTFYFSDDAAKKFNKQLDALKLMNTDPVIPNLFAVSADAEKLSIRALSTPNDTSAAIPLGLVTKKDGWITFNAKDIMQMPAGIYVYLSDSKTGVNHDLQKDPLYRLYLASGDYENRFSVVFSLSELRSNNTVNNETFNAYSSGGKLFVNYSLPSGEKANLAVYNMLGQMVYKEELNGNGNHPINTNFTSGMYVVSFYSNKKVNSKKVFIEK